MSYSSWPSDSLYEVKIGDIIQSKTTNYQVQKFHGEGTFGKVAKCLDLKTSKPVAVKVLKQSNPQFIRYELEMLRAIKVLDPEQYNIVSFMEHFMYRELSFMTFEMLDKSLWNLIEEQNFAPLPLEDIRHVTEQLLVAFDGLKSIGVIHADLKLDNIMLVNHHDQPFKVKLIDFGAAMQECQAENGIIIQNCAYRAPEVSLGLPFNTAVDMWGLGCVIAELFFGVNFMPMDCEYENMRAIVSLLGYPEEYKLDKAMHGYMYFKRTMDGSYQLRSPAEYNKMTGKICQAKWRFCDDFPTLDQAVLSQPGCDGALDYSERMAFLDFLKCCLTLDADQRISPKTALKHSFITKTRMDQTVGGIYKDSDPAPPQPQLFDAIRPNGLPSEKEEDGATPSKTESGNDVAAASDSALDGATPSKTESGNEVAAASDSACLIDDQVRASEHEVNVNQEQNQENLTLWFQTVLQNLHNRVNELQYDYNDMKSRIQDEQATVEALREEVRLLKENNTEMQAAKTSATSNSQENVAEENVAEDNVAENVAEENVAAPQEPPAPMKMKKTSSWWKRVKNFFTRRRRHRESDER